MNATGNLRDLETMMHESGHAIHSFLSKELELVDFNFSGEYVRELMKLVSGELEKLDHSG